MKTALVSVVLCLVLSACGGQSEQGYAPVSAIAPEAVSSELDGFNNLGDFLSETPALQGSVSQPAEPVPNDDGAPQFIAYTYNLGLTFPQAAVEPSLQAHVAACEAAGPRVCIVTNSSVNNQSDDYTNGYLSVRAVPAWIDTFLGGLDEEVAAAEGEITARNKQSVDLTRQILDTDARLNAKITLKGRLEDLLATREGDLGELLKVERELARVTGEIESITSNLKALRLRVSMSEMTIEYSTERSLISGGRSNPLATAFGDFFYNMSAALADVITFFAVGLPWLVLLGIFLFIWLRAIWPRIRKSKPKG